MSWSIPQLPQAFWGEVYVGGKPASVGVGVEARARVEGVVLVRPTSQNPRTVVEKGVLSESGAFCPLLVVQGDLREGGMGAIPDGTPIYFVVDGKVAWVLGEEGWFTQSIPFESGVKTHVILVV